MIIIVLRPHPHLWAFPRNPSFLFIEFRSSSLGVTVCVRPGVATFFIWYKHQRNSVQHVPVRETRRDFDMTLVTLYGLLDMTKIWWH